MYAVSCRSEDIGVLTFYCNSSEDVFQRFGSNRESHNWLYSLMRVKALMINKRLQAGISAWIYHLWRRRMVDSLVVSKSSCYRLGKELNRKLEQIRFRVEEEESSVSSFLDRQS